jgi:hypothetical protein
LQKSLCLVLFTMWVLPRAVAGQELPYYSRLNTFSAYSEYSDTSSYIHWGVSRHRRLGVVGASYARRFNAPHGFDWTSHASVFYEFEVVPLILLQDPIATDVYIYSIPPVTVSSSVVEVCAPGYYISPQGATFHRVSCSSSWRFMGGASPVGFRVNARPTRRVQPFIDSHLGFYASPQDEPVPDSSNFNFTFEFGAGIEGYRRNGTSLALEYRLHHFSNAYLAPNNPGVDNQIIKLTYSFGGRPLR